MINNFDNKRYLTLNNFYKQTFGGKVFKVSLNGNFTCPNIDGTIGVGGCIFCSGKGSGDFAGDKEDDLLTQFNKTKVLLDKKWPNSKYIAYFQANTNTYAPVEQLRKLYFKALTIDNVIGLSLSTRPDSISDETLDLLEELSHRTYLTVELGLQSIYAQTLKLINRGHDLECFRKMYTKLRERNINVVTHIINGLPGETKEMMLDTVRFLSEISKPQDGSTVGVKIHMLHILTDARLAEFYEKEKFHILTREEYVDIVCDQLELLRDNIVVHRVTGDADFDTLIEPEWIKKKLCVINEIDKELKRRNSYQGSNFGG